MKNSQKGFIAPLLLALIAILLIGGGVYLYMRAKQADQVVPASPTTQTTSVPINSFTASPSSGQAPLTVKFTDTISSAGDISIDYGDGSSCSTANPAGDQNCTLSQHTYTSGGVYAAILYRHLPTTELARLTVTVTGAGALPANTTANCQIFTDPSQLTSQQGVMKIGENYVRLRNCIYIDGESDPVSWVALIPADANSFQVLTSVLTKDKNHVFHVFFTNVASRGTIEEINGADPSTFVVLNDYYAKDKNDVYYYAANAAPVKLVAGADVQTFSVHTLTVANDWDAQDKNNRYLNGQKVL